MNKPHVAGGSSGGELICDLSAIPSDDRLHYRDLRLQLGTALISSKAINNGYVVRLNEELMSMADVSAWIRFESQCCPWLSLSAQRVERGTLEVRMKAPDRAKQVLQMELQELLPIKLLNEVMK
jgi:hypothetical protein